MSRSSHVTVTHRVDRGRRVYLRVWRDRSFGWERYTVDADGLETFRGYADGRLHLALEREVGRMA